MDFFLVQDDTTVKLKSLVPAWWQDLLRVFLAVDFDIHFHVDVVEEEFVVLESAVLLLLRRIVAAGEITSWARGLVLDKSIGWWAFNITFLHYKSNLLENSLFNLYTLFFLR